MNHLQSPSDSYPTPATSVHLPNISHLKTSVSTTNQYSYKYQKSGDQQYFEKIKYVNEKRQDPSFKELYELRKTKTLCDIVLEVAINLQSVFSYLIAIGTAFLKLLEQIK